MAGAVGPNQIRKGGSGCGCWRHFDAEPGPQGSGHIDCSAGNFVVASASASFGRLGDVLFAVGFHVGSQRCLKPVLSGCDSVFFVRGNLHLPGAPAAGRLDFPPAGSQSAGFLLCAGGDCFPPVIQWFCCGHTFTFCPVWGKVYLVFGLRLAGPPQKRPATFARAVVSFSAVLGQQQCSLPQRRELSCADRSPDGPGSGRNPTQRPQARVVGECAQGCFGAIRSIGPLLVRLFHFQPFWGSTNVPYPKGESYLARIEARTGQDLAVTQLKGLKLVLWASVLKVVLALFDQLVHGSPGCFSRWLPGSFCVPYLQTAIAAHLARQPFPRDLCWLSVMANFCVMLLNISIMGHFIIGICRMAGFNALRNTYRPLASTTIAEFYNRVYYYFKELLVDFFFYPAYFRYFKDRPRLRLFFATLAAAGFGNLLYHILASIGAVSQIGLWRLIVKGVERL